MKSSTLAVITASNEQTALLDSFSSLGVALLFCSDSSDAACADLTLVCLHTREINQPPNSAWLAWDLTGSSQAIAMAYQAGARSVFPKDTPFTVITETIRRTMADLARNGRATRLPRQRTFSRGELILLESDEVLQIEKGILATTMVHQDGIEVLIGLSGKGQVIVAHPNDNCHIQIISHTDSTVKITSWEDAVSQPDFSQKIRARLQQMEGWAAMQARPSLQGRVLRLLGLLADQFGQPLEDGTLIDVRITHHQLAAAVGATRTSITRTLSELRAQGKVLSVSRGGEDFFCLSGTPEHHHHC